MNDEQQSRTLRGVKQLMAYLLAAAVLMFSLAIGLELGNVFEFSRVVSLIVGAVLAAVGMIIITIIAFVEGRRNVA